MILICENCEYGYHKAYDKCPWCGTSAVMAHLQEPLELTCDTECYSNYWLCQFKALSGVPLPQPSFELFDGHPLDVQGLCRVLSKSRIFTFNGNAYDLPMIALAISGAANDWLKRANDQIIKDGQRSWEFYDHWGIRRPDWIDHIDLIEVAPGGGSLKMYGGKMHSRRLQDLPYDPSQLIDWHHRPVLREYCDNDLETTADLRRAMSAQIALREQMSAEYGIDLRSKSDAQIAESVMKRVLPFKVEVPMTPTGSQFYYRPPAWLRFINLPLLELLARSPFTVNCGTVTMMAELDSTAIRIGNSVYRMGIGGLHSSESSIAHVADTTHSMQDVDVTGYYPSLILITGIYPEQIGPAFQDIYRSWVERRVTAKRAGDKKTANSLKTVTNGTFGKLGSPYSIFYAPSELIQVTITGQLALLMLIESLELCGINVISANTDGILIRCVRALEWLRDSIVANWRSATGFETEAVNYRLIASRDVNNYIAIDVDGKPKLKGAFAPPEPGASGWPNPTGTVCVDAIVAYLSDGTPLEQTIRACTDVRRFVHIRRVKGGGEWLPGPAMNKSATQREMRELVGQDVPKEQLRDLYAAQFANHEPEYLGRAVRWYYAREGAGHIRYVDSGNKVATTDGCRPLMTLPDALPADVDYDKYINESRAMLADLGVIR